MRTLTFILSGAFLLAAPIVKAQDNSTDILIQVLLRKGILSESEASEIRQ